MREKPSAEWSARHFWTHYRALRRGELAAMAADAGFRAIEWLETAATGYYQPMLAARTT